MTSRIVLISNPASGYNRRRGLHELHAVAERHGIRHYQAATPEAIMAACDAMTTEWPDIIAINGGDGTVDVIANWLRTKNGQMPEPALALLRGGTTNMIHRDCGWAARPAKALEKLIAGQGNVVVRRPLEILRQDHENLYGFFLGIGAIPRVILATRASLHRHGMMGPVGEALAALAILIRLKLRYRLDNDKILAPLLMHWQIDGARQSEVRIFKSITSLRRLILNLHMTGPDDRLSLLFMAADRKLKRLSVAEIQIVADEPWVLDGEFFPPARLDIRLGNPFNFITG